jgi:hypothetical protein
VRARYAIYEFVVTVDDANAVTIEEEDVLDAAAEKARLAFEKALPDKFGLQLIGGDDDPW